jgi:DhnA family fructose-bisphosphate aldolase class Ia
MFLGKEIRLNRLFNPKTGRLMAVMLDHPITRDVLPGLVDIRSTMAKVVAGRPDAITMHKGIAEKVFAPHVREGGPGIAGVSLILKSSAYCVMYHPYVDTPVAEVHEAVRLGADAISVGVIVGGPEQAVQLTRLGHVSDEAASAGMPLVAHIYPKGSMIKDSSDADRVAYAVRAGAELGVDLIKTFWTGSAQSFKKVIAACPAKVALAGGDIGTTLEEHLTVIRSALDIGLAGITFGRFVWQHEHPTAVIRALYAMVHEDVTLDGAMKVYREALAEEKA